jgi:FlaA1/EpsC-like NDP-sugar epimerase
MPLFAVTYCCAFLLRFAGEVGSRLVETCLPTLLWVLAVKWLVFLWFRLHQGWTRYIGFHDLLVLGQAVTVGALAVTLVDAMILPWVTIPRSIILLDWGMTLLAVGAARALPRLIRDDARHLFAPTRGATSLIVGATDSGETLLRAIRANPSLNLNVVGFVDDRAQLQAARIGGVPVLGTTNNLPQLAARYGVDEVLLTTGDLPGKWVRELLEAAGRHGFRVHMLPSYEQLLEGRVAVHPRPVAIEDLLCRPAVELDLDAVRGWISGRSILVTGSAGSIGSEICRQLVKLQPSRLVLVDRSETGQFYLGRELNRLSARDANCGLSPNSSQPAIRNPKSEIHTEVFLADINDRARMSAVLRQTRPEIIFHAAAYKHVPLMESHCGEAVKNIVLATRNLVDLADDFAVGAFVMISTDKAVNPTSVMGACKRLAEEYVQARSPASSCRMVTVRFGNVLDSSGSVVPVFREQISRGGPVTVTHADITRYFMLIPEAAQLVIQAGAMGQGGEIFVLDMGEPVRILDLAHDMIRLSGLRVGEDIEVQITGLRPGEKLYEELYDARESHQRTDHPKILVAASACRPLSEVVGDLSRLESLVHRPNAVIRAALHDAVPLHSAERRAVFPAAA